MAFQSIYPDISKDIVLKYVTISAQTYFTCHKVYFQTLIFICFKTTQEMFEILSINHTHTPEGGSKSH